MLGRLVHSADFERMRSAPTWSRSAHFALHHLPTGPSRPGRRIENSPKVDLSTGIEDKLSPTVDNMPSDHWLGTVIPKRLARRSVTRNLLRRQIRNTMAQHLDRLPPGLWVVRLRSTFARQEYISAASMLLRRAAGEELVRLLNVRRALR